MRTKIIIDKGIYKLVSRYNPFYQCDDYYIRTLISDNPIDIEINRYETELILNKMDFQAALDSSEKRHNYDYDELLKNVVCNYVMEEYGEMTTGVRESIRALIKYPTLTKEFYENVVLLGKLPQDGIRLKGRTAYEILTSNNCNEIQAYVSLVNSAKDMKRIPKSEEKKVNKTKKTSDNTIIM